MSDTQEPSASEVKSEGMEHIKNNSDASEKTPVADPATDGSGSSSGDVSSSAHVPGSEEHHRGYVESAVDTVKTYLGYGGIKPDADRNAGEESSAAAPATAAKDAVVAGAAQAGLPDTATTLADRSSSNTGTSNFDITDSAKNDTTSSAIPATSDSTSTDTADSSIPATTDSTKNDTIDPTINPTAEEKMTEAAPSTGATAATADESEGKEETGEAKPIAKEYDNIQGEKKKTTGPENPSAIPTAGGEQLGKQHWGESKIVPDNPKPRESVVQSSEGQPDQQTMDNTSKNAGGGSSGEEKPSMGEKIKEKLHMGGK